MEGVENASMVSISIIIFSIVVIVLTIIINIIIILLLQNCTRPRVIRFSKILSDFRSKGLNYLILYLKWPGSIRSLS